jgi:hypothetical protein
VQSGGLQKVQQMRVEEGSKLQESINAINACYPPEIVQVRVRIECSRLVECVVFLN